MGQFIAGQVVSVQFPFSNLKQIKRRPALILAQAEFQNLILCQITSKPYASQQALELQAKDFASGSLPITSYIRPDKIFTCDPEIIERIVGHLSEQKINQVKQSVRFLFDSVSF